MSTRKDVETKLRALDSEALYFIAADLKLELDLAREGDEAFIQKLLKGYDGNPSLKVLLLRALDFPTAEEAQTEAAAKALEAAERSAKAAEQSAAAAQRSANAAEKSERHAESMKHARWIAIGLSLAALLIAVGHMIVNVVIAFFGGK